MYLRSIVAVAHKQQKKIYWPSVQLADTLIKVETVFCTMLRKTHCQFPAKFTDASTATERRRKLESDSKKEWY
jgi:hypothetical protein